LIDVFSFSLHGDLKTGRRLCLLFLPREMERHVLRRRTRGGRSLLPLQGVHVEFSFFPPDGSTFAEAALGSPPFGEASGVRLPPFSLCRVLVIWDLGGRCRSLLFAAGWDRLAAPTFSESRGSRSYRSQMRPTFCELSPRLGGGFPFSVEVNTAGFFLCLEMLESPLVDPSTWPHLLFFSFVVNISFFWPNGPESAFSSPFCVHATRERLYGWPFG